MRTTIDLPTNLFRRAKARAAERGETLKSLVTRALAVELGHAEESRTTRARVVLPLFGRPGGPTVKLRNVDLERALAHDDALKAAPPGRRRRR